MKKQLNYFYTFLLFIGMLFSCFQFAPIKVSKAKKSTTYSFTMDEEEKEGLKKNTENFYLASDFEYSFSNSEIIKVGSYIHEHQKLEQPALNINTPPPKI